MFLMAVGERIQVRLEQLDLSQSELARRTRLHQTTINQLINKNSTSRFLPRIARELQTSVAYLEGETDDPTAEMPDEVYTSEERATIDLWRMLDPADRATVRALMQSLAKREPRNAFNDSKPEYRPG